MNRPSHVDLTGACPNLDIGGQHGPTPSEITATPVDHWRVYEVDGATAKKIVAALRKGGIDHRTGPASNVRVVVYARAVLNLPGVDIYEK